MYTALPKEKFSVAADLKSSVIIRRARSLPVLDTDAPCHFLPRQAAANARAPVGMPQLLASPESSSQKSPKHEKTLLQICPL